MRREGEEVHLNEIEASGGSKEGVLRWILILGVLLAIVLLTIVWITGAVSTSGDEQNVSVSDQIQAGEQTPPDTSVTNLGNDNVPSTDGQVTEQDGLTVVENN